MLRSRITPSKTIYVISNPKTRKFTRWVKNGNYALEFEHNYVSCIHQGSIRHVSFNGHT